MKHIRLLSNDIANQIAAGEVIERPASVIKELVENSLDAGASSITIETRGGGIEYMRVTDNGSGIMREDVPIAFLPHATSKITNADDLYHIETLGFRGEALASIAAVSKVTLSTMTKDDEAGTRLVVKAGETHGCVDTASLLGTTIEVEDLFFNVPARLKFLKSPRSEASYISDMVSRLILANPSIAIKLIQNGKLIYQSAGDSNIDNAIYSIYGNDVLSHLRNINHDDGYIKITGRIGTEQLTYSNRTRQSLFINSRYFKSNKLSYSLSRAYDTRLMSGMFPFCVIYISMSSSDMDVNVHPGKLEIRFRDEERVSHAITAAARRALAETAYNVREMTGMPENRVDNTNKSKNTLSFKPNVSRTPEGISGKIDVAGKMGEDISVAETLKKLRDDIEKHKVREKNHNVLREANSDYKMYSDLSINKSNNEKTSISEPEHKILQEPARTKIISAARKNENDAESKTHKIQTRFAAESYRIAGQLFDCYIIVEQGNDIFFIDQHAAHERKLYEDYIAKDIQVDSQLLLTPTTVRLTPIEYDIYQQNSGEFEKLGFEIEEFGSLSINIRAVPYIMGEAQTVEFLHEALSVLADKKKTSAIELKRSSLIQSACKHAIKQGERLPDELIEELLRQVRDEGVPLTCPHGRPIMLKMSKQEFEKQFKRVL